VAADLVAVNASGAEAAPDMSNVGSPETYVGYDRAEDFISPGGAVQDARHVYAAVTPRLNEWALSGDWTARRQKGAWYGRVVAMPALLGPVLS
jgi:hypothetical protein